jgi:alpha,alpha-trehalase
MLNVDTKLIQIQGRLFEAVQTQGLFSDSKQFVDAIPNIDPQLILQKYDLESGQRSFSLNDFIQKHFSFPQVEESSADLNNIEQYLKATWDHLTRRFKEEKYSTSISLPKPHIVPGGRFRECYYWDSYFTALGLIIHNRIDLLKDMVENFAYLIDTYGYIPNGNRVYYLSRSQPPFFSHLLQLLEEAGIDSSPYFSQLEAEYLYWMSTERTVEVQGHRLNRYYDYKNSPREEGYKEDLDLNLSGYKEIRAACESGWDFSSRWFKDGKNLTTIHTTNIIPVDLNCLLFHMEKMLGSLAEKNNLPKKMHLYQNLAKKRSEAINDLLWNEEQGFYFDYFIRESTISPHFTLAGLYPLFVQIATEQQGKKVTKKIESSFLAKGGLRTTLANTSQQWDGSNGWAPLQWIGYLACKQYNQTALAHTIAERWTQLNEKIFAQTHRFVEKYQVDTLSLEVQDGEYTLQEGFGWSNGVYLMLKKELGTPLSLS